MNTVSFPSPDEKMGECLGMRLAEPKMNEMTKTFLLVLVPMLSSFLFQFPYLWFHPRWVGKPSDDHSSSIDVRKVQTFAHLKEKEDVLESYTYQVVVSTIHTRYPGSQVSSVCCHSVCVGLHSVWIILITNWKHKNGERPGNEAT